MNKEIQEEINALIIEADERVKERKFEEALSIYENALKKAKEIGWSEREMNILDMIESANNMKKELEMEKRKSEEQRKKYMEEIEKQKRLEAASERLKEKEKKERMKKIEQLREKKRKQEEMLNKVYDILAKGSELLEREEFEASIGQFNKARELVEQLNIPTELQRVKDLIEEAEFRMKEKKLREKKKHQEQDLEKEFEKKKELLMKEDSVRKDREHAKVLEQEREEQLDRDKRKKMEDEAYKFIDLGTEAAKNHDYDAAIKYYRKAKNIFKEVGSEHEVTSVAGAIADFRLKKKKIEAIRNKKQEELLRKTREDEEFSEKADFRKRVEDEQIRQKEELEKDLSEEEARKKNIADEILAQLEALENKVNEYERQRAHKPILELECPYREAIELYTKAEKVFREIGWNTEAQKMIDAVNDYKERIERDDKLREVERKKIRQEEEERKSELKEMDALRRLKEKERKKELERIMREREKKEQYNRIYEESLKLIEEANGYRERDEFDKAIEIYMRVKEMYNEIDYSDGLRIVDEAIASINQEKMEFLEMQEIKKKLTKLEREQSEEREKSIEQSRKELQERKAALEKKRLDKELERKREMEVQNKVIEIMAEAGKMLENKEFDNAIKLYNDAIELVKTITWPLKAEQIRDLIHEAQLRKAEFLKKEQLRKEKEEKEREMQKQLQEMIERKKREEEERRRKLMELEREKMAKEQKIKEMEQHAWDALEQGERYLKQNDYYFALKKFLEGYAIFKEMEWMHEAGTTKTRILQVFSMIKDPFISKFDLLEKYNANEWNEVFGQISKIQEKRQEKRFDEAISLLKELISFASDAGFGESAEFMKKWSEKIEGEKKQYEDYLKNKDTIPNLENAMKLMDEANKKADLMKYQEAIELAERARQMLEEIGNTREARLVQQNIIRWKYKSQKIEEQIRKITRDKEG